MIALLVTATLFTFVGHALAYLWPMSPLPRRTERLAEAFLLGVGGVGTALFALGVAGVPLRLATIVALITAAAFALARTHRRPLPHAGESYPWLASVLLVIPFMGVAADALVLPLADWHGLITWTPKAHTIARDGSLYAPFFYGAAGLNLHNHYPLLLPIDAAVVMRLCRSMSVNGIRWLYALIPISLLLTMRGRLASVCGAQPAAWITAIAAWIPIVTIGQGSASSAYGDLAVAAFAGAALLALITRPVDEAGRE